MSGLYDDGRNGFLDGTHDWDTDAFDAYLVDDTYTPNYGTHDNLSDITANQRMAGPVALASKTASAGVADADDTAFGAVSAGSTSGTCAGVVIVKNGTNDLVSYTDLSFDANGSTVTVRWDSGTNKIFKL